MLKNLKFAKVVIEILFWGTILIVAGMLIISWLDIVINYGASDWNFLRLLLEIF